MYRNRNAEKFPIDGPFKCAKSFSKYRKRSVPDIFFNVKFTPHAMNFPIILRGKYIKTTFGCRGPRNKEQNCLACLFPNLLYLNSKCQTSIGKKIDIK